SGYEIGKVVSPFNSFLVSLAATAANSAVLRTGRGLRISVLITVKTVVFAPIPRASVMSTKTTKVGFFRMVRSAYRRSLRRSTKKLAMPDSFPTVGLKKSFAHTRYSVYNSLYSMSNQIWGPPDACPKRSPKRRPNLFPSLYPWETPGAQRSESHQRPGGRTPPPG